MDLGFHTRRAAATATPVAAPADTLDYGAIVAALAADQAGCPTAALAGRIARPADADLSREEALVALFLGAADWVHAAAVLDGSFDADLAKTLHPAAEPNPDRDLYPPV